ncbi:hypothetical protein HII36_19780 [Nonomuraea sp. NN258]|uniref:hypothetical protein n=1 Tax=Nonomuraea antri TaxID=2730852 RepID=UPI0015688665|nr:hypothetical protein [Nonomuraea antri]NRQ34075.1 hypothetical protein [Nonomuraea antri]
MPEIKETLADVRPMPDEGGRRRRGLVVGLAAVTLVAAVGAGGALFLAPSPSTAGVGTAGTATVVQRTEVRPIEEVWPQAAHEVPMALPDGRRIRPRLLLDGKTLLVTAESSFEKADGLYAYDLGGGRFAKLADVPVPAGTRLFAAGFATDGDRIVWWTGRKKDGREIADIWSVPASGGEPAIVTSAVLPARSAEGLIATLAVTPEGVAWSAGGEGVYRVPFSGGRPQPVPGTRGLHILAWPWAGSPGPAALRQVPFLTLLNVDTGERRDRVSVQDAAVVACGVTRCLSRQGRSSSVGLHARDGSEGTALTLPPTRPQVLLRDRFVTADSPSGATLHDVTTATAADLGSSAGTRYFPSGDGRMLLFSRGEKFLVVDLAAIG